MALLRTDEDTRDLLHNTARCDLPGGLLVCDEAQVQCGSQQQATGRVARGARLEKGSLMPQQDKEREPVTTFLGAFLTDRDKELLLHAMATAKAHYIADTDPAHAGVAEELNALTLKLRRALGNA